MPSCGVNGASHRLRGCTVVYSSELSSSDVEASDGLYGEGRLQREAEP